MVDLAQTASPLEVVYTVGALFAVAAFLVLLSFALRDQHLVALLPEQHPDRMVAGDAVLNEVLRIMLAFGILIIGVVAVLTPPAPPSTNAEPSALGVVLFVVLEVWEVGLLVWGIKDLWFRRRLFKRMAAIRIICTGSTYGECPFVRGAGQPEDTVSSMPEALVEPPEIQSEGGAEHAEH